MKSFTGRPNTHAAGDNLVSGLGVMGIRVQIAIVARLVCDETLDGLHTNLCPTVAVGEATLYESVVYTPIDRKTRVAVAVYSGLSSVEISSGMP